MTLDPYRALGVRRDASEAEVKAAHRRLAKRFHPDAGGDHERFLRVQEAYRVLSDPLLRREWDDKHAPGPVRAARQTPPPPPRPRTRPAKPDREAAAAPQPEEPTATGQPLTDEPASRRPRSSRAYTWSASEVPWWEEGATSNRRQQGRRRQPRPAEPAPEPRADPQRDTMPPPPDASPNAFDVYNRSSGAAWSMAARAYFRRGDQDLPRRGTFHYEGTQVLTGGRARAAAAAAAASAAASQSTAWAPSAAPAAAAAPAPAAEAARPSAYAGVSRDARQIQRARESFRRRLNATAWPSLRERLFYASLAWIPVAIAIGYGAASVTGCDVASVACPPNLETMQTIAIAISLGLLVALPRVAYVAALASLGALVVGIVVVGAVALLGVQQPVPASATMLIVGSLVLGYAATAAVVLLRDPSTKPWAPASQSIPR